MPWTFLPIEKSFHSTEGWLHFLAAAKLGENELCRERETETERDRQTDTERQTDRQRETERGRGWTERERGVGVGGGTERERERERVPFAGCCDAAGETGCAERSQVDDGGLCA